MIKNQGLIEKTTNTPAFMVLLGGNTVDTYESDDETKHIFLIGSAGECMIVRATFDHTFSAKVDERRVYVYAPGTWLGVEVLDEIDPEEVQDAVDGTAD